MTTAPQSDAAWFEKVFVFFVLLLSSGAFINLTITTGQDEASASGQAATQVLWMATHLFALALMLWKCREALRNSMRQYLLVALTLLAVTSTLWSADPGITLRRSAALVLTCLFGGYFGFRFTLREQLRLLASVAGVCVVFSLIFGILGLGNPIEDIPNAWYGVFVHKNALGRMMVLSILIFLISAKAMPEKRARFWFGASLAFVLLLLARSTTSLAVLAAMVGFLVCCPVLRRSKSGLIKGTIAAMVVFGLGLYWASQNLEYVLGLFGKDLTLTGRLQLWVLSAAMAIQTPWLGHGYNAFWLGPGSASDRILAVVQWDAPHAHNGLLELWLELGLVGVAVFLVGFVLYVGRAISLLRENSAAESLWPLCFLAFMFVSNLTESDFLARNAIFWIVYVAVVTGLRRTEETLKRPVLTKSALSLVRANPRVCEG